MLPSLLPDCRIMTFGYESQWLGPEALQQRLDSVANQLLHGLECMREQCKGRAVVFIGSCVGGLVVEKVRLLQL